MSNRMCRWIFEAALFMVLCLAPAGLARAADEEECLRCHGLSGLTTLGENGANPHFIDSRYFESSVHSLLNCRECHSDIAAIPHPDAAPEISCGQPCHQRDQEGNPYSHESLFWTYTASVHGQAESGGIGCVTCHPAGSLGELSRRDLLLEADQCASCHRRDPHVKSFFGSLHYRALAGGSRRAPSCPDCHTSHGILPADNPEATIHPERLAATCGAGALGGGAAGRCHGELTGEVVQGAAMNPLPLAGSRTGTAAWLFTALYWGLLGGLAFRVLYGVLRGR